MFVISNATRYSPTSAQGTSALRQAAFGLFVLASTTYFVGCYSTTVAIPTIPPPATGTTTSYFEPSLAVSLVQIESHDRFEIAGLPPTLLADLKQLEPGDSAWQARLAVYVGSPKPADALPLLGDYRIDGDKLVFEPRFPLRPGTAYTAAYPLVAGENNGLNVSQEFKLPAAKEKPRVSISAIYPTRDVLPENQLKFYLHFSGPMSRGEAYQRIHLLKTTDEAQTSGEEVESPFLELGEELWDESGTRFTLFFDPGRIKRGLKPREEVGPSLIEESSYVLVVDKEWLDAEGRPLSDGFRKSFQVGPPDDVQPSLSQWKVSAPSTESAQPLVVQFNESLDEAMLQRVFSIVDATGKSISGEAVVDEQETRWTFTPNAKWQAGKYELLVDASLEDLAGNSFAKPFEVDVFEKIDRQTATETVRLPFEVR